MGYGLWAMSGWLGLGLGWVGIIDEFLLCIY